MGKIIKFCIIFLFISVVFSGCKQQDNKLELREDIKEVNIFKSNDFKIESSDLIVSSSDADNTEIYETVKRIINDAIKQEGIVDITEPDYDLEIIYEDDSTKEIYLWLLKDGVGTLMEVEDTHTGYNFSKELNDELINLIGLIDFTSEKGKTEKFTYNELELEVTNVKDIKVETMIDDGGTPWEYNVFICYPEARITILEADMTEGSFAEDGKSHPSWGIELSSGEPIRIVENMDPFDISSDVIGIYNLEASLYILKFEIVSE